MPDYNFFTTSMPDSRPADYYLGCLDGSVFLDFNNVGNDKVCLIRISFDGYGCCELGSNAMPLNKEDAIVFKTALLNGIKDQKIMTAIVKKAIALNKEWIWEDAVGEYELRD